MEKKSILVINTGSTSSKIALFEDDKLVKKASLTVDPAITGKMIKTIEQLDVRREAIFRQLDDWNVDFSKLDIIVARGGLTPSCKGGAYAVNQLMVDLLTYAPEIQHESNLSSIIGWELSKKHGDIPVITYDSIAVDELDEVSRITGAPEIQNKARCHVLNMRKAAKEMAKKLGKKYEDCTFVVGHFGGGISVSLQKNGRFVDLSNNENGPLTPQRAGRLPTIGFMKLCYSGKFTIEEMEKYLIGQTGFIAYFGTQDTQEVEKMIENGNEKAKLVYSAMALQTAKAIGEMAVSAKGQVERIIFTGGMANSKMFTGMVAEHVGFIAPIEIMAGEFEMEALALGGLEVLNGEQEAKFYDIVPEAYVSVEDFYSQVIEPEKAGGK